MKKEKVSKFTVKPEGHESIRSAVQKQAQLRAEIGEITIVSITTEKRLQELQAILDSKAEEHSRVTVELDKLTQEAAAKLGIDVIKESGWKLNIDTMEFSRN